MKKKKLCLQFYLMLIKVNLLLFFVLFEKLQKLNGYFGRFKEFDESICT